MPEPINNSLALQIQQPDIAKTLSTLSQVDLAKAHAGLFGLQAQQEARKLHANQAIQELGMTPEGITEFAKRGGDPSAIEGYQKGYATNNAFAKTGGLMTGDVKNLTESGLAAANTRKSNEETTGVQLGNTEKLAEVGARSAQMIIAGNGSNDSLKAAYDYVRSSPAGAKVANDLHFAEAMKMTPQQRVERAKMSVAGGMSPAEYTQPHNVPNDETVQTRAGMLNAPQQGGMMPGGGSIISGGPAQPPAPNAQAQPPGQPPGQPSPNAQVANRFGVIPPAMTPGQLKESEAYGGEMAKVLPNLNAKAESARQQNFTLDQMKAESESWRMGKWADVQMKANQFIKPFADAWGYTGFDKPVADFESFKKNTGTLTRQAVKEVSSRAAAQEFTMIQNQLPAADMSHGGFNQISDQFQAVNDYQIAKQQAGQKWWDNHRTMDGFESTWNKNVTPSVFLMQRLSPQQRNELKTRLDGTESGRAVTASIERQWKWARQNIGQVER